MNRTDQPQAQDRALFQTVTRAGLLVLVLGQAAAGHTDTDIWGHMSIGLDMLAKRAFLWVDPYSFTHDQVWVNHEWLWDVGTASIFRAAGLPGLIALRAVLAAVVLGLADRATRRLDPSLRIAAIVLVGLACIGQWRSTRPQIATLAIYALVVGHPDAWWLPGIFLLWANLHGGWLFGLAAVWCQATLGRSRRGIAVAAASTLATLANPYGLGLWSALAEAMSRGWSDLMEWQPIWRLSAGVDALMLWLLVASATVFLLTRVHRHLAVWAWVAIALVAAAGSRRLIALATLTSVIALAPRWIEESVPVPFVWTRARQVFAGGVMACCIAASLFWMAPSATCFPPLPGWHTPEAGAVAFLRGEPVVRLVPHFDYGEYAIYHLRDRLTVAIDNRRETVYSDDRVRENQRFMDGLDLEYPDRIGADAVWWPTSGRAVIDGLEQRGWTRRFEGPRTTILMRAAGPLLRGVDTPGTPCFPNP